jgi:hypothetical protein
MRRIPHFLLAILAGVMIAGIASAAPAIYDQVWGNRVDEQLCEIDEVLEEVEFDECAATTTTTTSTTSTTQPPTTTTTTPEDLEIPETLPYPRGLKAAGGYDIILSCIDTEDIVCLANGGTRVWWSAPYLGTNLPYTDESTWLDGDREGYRCAYGFLEYQGEIVGAFGAVRPTGQGYGKVNDRYMDEGVRYLDGSLTGKVGGEIPEEDCQAGILSPDVDYTEVYEGPDERPRIGFFGPDGQILDIRDYTNTTLQNPGKFRLISFDGTTAIIGFYPVQNNQAAITFYYWSMGDGQIAVDFEGTGPFAP